VYHRQPLYRVLLWPETLFALTLFVLLACGAYLDKLRTKKAVEGRHIRGPKVISNFEFNLRSLFRRGFYFETGRPPGLPWRK
jgi:hypothetical protein